MGLVEIEACWVFTSQGSSLKSAKALQVWERRESPLLPLRSASHFLTVIICLFVLSFLLFLGWVQFTRSASPRVWVVNKTGRWNKVYLSRYPNMWLHQDSRYTPSCFLEEVNLLLYSWFLFVGGWLDDNVFVGWRLVAHLLAVLTLAGEIKWFQMKSDKRRLVCLFSLWSRLSLPPWVQRCFLLL